jgi:hypothetical protein
MITLALASFISTLQPLDLETLDIARARSLDGKPVVVTFLVGKPPWTLRGATIIGPDDSQAVSSEPPS